MIKLCVAVVAVLSVSVIGTAGADEGFYPLVRSGTWSALAHHTSSIAAPDTCGVSGHAAESQSFILRVDEVTKEMRVSDEAWALPPDVRGTVKISIDRWNKEFDVRSGTSPTMLTALLSTDELLDLVAAMDNGSIMKLEIGKTTMNVSLSGSTRATNAFMSCANLKSSTKPTSDSNPFDAN